MNVTTCFGPICGPYSGCDLTYRTVIQDECVFFRILGIGLREEGGKRPPCFNSGYYDLGLLQVDYH